MFKECPNCKTIWDHFEDFITDRALTQSGYQVNFVNLKKGLFLFTHSCHTTFSVEVDAFSSLYEGPVFTTPLHGHNRCPSYCLYETILDRCPMECECAFVREIIQILKAKQNAS